MAASSISKMGMLSRTGYTRRHWAHFNPSPLFLTVSGFLHAGQTRMSSSSLGITRPLYRSRASCSCSAASWRSLLQPPSEILSRGQNAPIRGK